MESENQLALRAAGMILGRASLLERADSHFLAGITVHELLHRLVDEMLGGMFPSTPLLKKYQDEPLLVRRHLHVDAIQKAVYLRMDRADKICAIIANDSADLGPDYARAWDIVNRREGFGPFVYELMGQADGCRKIGR